jgi:nucleoside-diphosphate-sugar epimerase
MVLWVSEDGKGKKDIIDEIDIWREKMRVLVLGGSGLFGRKTVLHLLKDPEIAFVVSSDVALPPDWILKQIEPYKEKFRFVRGDVGEMEDLLNIIKTYSIDRIVNFAFLLPGIVESNPRPGIKVNYLGMCNSFEAARLMDIKRVVYASSEGVYGPQNEYGDRDVNEDDHLHPGSGYALAKQMSEILADQYARLYSIKFSALRPPIGYGHGGLTPMPVRNFSEIVSLPAVGKAVSFKDDGTNTVSLAMTDDIAVLTLLLIKATESPHPAYNLGGPPTSLRDVAAVVKKYIPDANISFGINPPPKDRGNVGIPWRLDTNRAKKDFGFSCMSLDQAVKVHINDARLEAGLSPMKF